MDEDEQIQEEDDLFTLCTALEEYKELLEKSRLENTSLRTNNSKLLEENETLSDTVLEYESNIDALEEALSGLLDELDAVNLQLAEKESDLQSLQACLGAIHRRKIEVDDFAKQQQRELIDKLQSEKHSVDASNKSNQQLISEYEELVNNKDSEILDLKCALRELEVEKRDYLNQFRGTAFSNNHDRQDGFHSDDSGGDHRSSYNIEVDTLDRMGSALRKRIQTTSSSAHVKHPPAHSPAVKLKDIVLLNRMNDNPVSASPARRPSHSSHNTNRTQQHSPHKSPHKSPHRRSRRHNSHSNKQSSAPLSSSFSEDDYRLSRRHGRSAHLSEEEDDEEEDQSPVALTVRRTASAIQQSARMRLENVHRANQILNNSNNNNVNNNISSGAMQYGRHNIPSDIKWEEAATTGMIGGRSFNSNSNSSTNNNNNTSSELLFREAKVLPSNTATGGRLHNSKYQPVRTTREQSRLEEQEEDLDDLVRGTSSTAGTRRDSKDSGSGSGWKAAKTSNNSSSDVHLKSGAQGKYDSVSLQQQQRSDGNNRAEYSRK